MCATTAEQNKFARDVVGKPCLPVPLIGTKKDACTRFAEIVVCAATPKLNEFARDVVGNPCRPVPLTATNANACTRFAEIVSQANEATEYTAS